jgi:hypothetical protein
MRRLLAGLLAVAGLCLVIPIPASATIVGHLDADAVAALPQSVMDGIGDQRWLFTHASVGANMIEGMQALHSENPGRYQLVFATAGDWSQVYPPPPVTIPGTVYDGARGNPGWAAKFQIFDDAVRDLGWRSPTVDIAMDKLCYIDTDANVNVYLATIVALENDFPATRFVYMTMPLQSGENMNWANILATNYNNAVRSHCAGSNRTLLDIADIESHDPSGNHATFLYDGRTYERMYIGYTTDGGHLNSLGCRRVALGWYAAAGAIFTAGASSPDMVGSSVTGIRSIAPNPTRDAVAIRFVIESAGAVDLSMYDAHGRLVGSLVEKALDAGEHVIWVNAADGEAIGATVGDRPGRDLPAGIYFLRLQTAGTKSTRRLVLIR